MVGADGQTYIMLMCTAKALSKLIVLKADGHDFINTILKLFAHEHVVLPGQCIPISVMGLY